MRPIITLTTDFGTHDSYVGAMKGVLLAICPDATLVDITHDIPPQDMTAAAFVLRTSTPYFPPGTVHMVVVDPGVGSERQPMAFSSPQGKYVGPNNGVFGLLWQRACKAWPGQVAAVHLTEQRFWRPQVSATFHGRDIFSPVSAHLAAGVPLNELGPPLENVRLLAAVAEPRSEKSGWLRGQVVYIDHFGNCISNISLDHLQQIGPLDTLTVVVGARRLPISRTYARVAQGAALALVSSDGYLEIAVRDGNASHLLTIDQGTTVQVGRSGR